MRHSKEITAAANEQLKRRSGSQANYTTTKTIQRKIYDTLYESLLEEGYPISARYFERMVNKELDLILTDLKFKKRVSDAHCLLLAIVENIKSAETAFRDTGDKQLTLKLLVQTVHMIQVQDDAFHWLVKEVYKIILRISEGWEDECAEILSRTHYEYGAVLTEKGDELLNEAIYQMSLSLETCKGTMWYTNEKDRNILHEDVCVKLCETLLRQAKIDSKTDPRKAADLAYRAVLTITEVGISGNKNLYCIAKLRQSEYLISACDYEGAMRVLTNLQNHVMAHDSPRNKCEFYLWLGICHFYLSPKAATALRKFKLSLCLSDTYNFTNLKADALLFQGKIHAKYSETQAQARQSFIQAKELFHELKDVENEKLANFLMAKLRAYQIFQCYIELIEKSSWSSFCHLFDLIQWKQRMLPFWNEQIQLHSYTDQLQCLLQEEVGKELIPHKD